MIILLAALPLGVALIMLAGLQRSGLQTSIVTLCVAIAIALLIPSLRLSLIPLAIALASGFSSSLTVLTVLFPALLLYQLQQARKGMSVLAQGIARLCPDRDVRILLVVLGIAPFVESVSGFGVGTVVVIPVLIAIGVDILQAAVLGVSGQIAVPWGALAVGTTLAAQLTQLNASVLGGYTALITAPLPIGFGLLTLAMSGGRVALARHWYVACATGIVLAAGEWFFSLTTSVELAGALASLASLTLLTLWGYVLSRRTSVTRQAEIPETHAVENKSVVQQRAAPLSSPPLWRIVAPYIFLTLTLLLSRLLSPIRAWLQSHAVLDVPLIALHLQLLYIPGFWVLLTACVTTSVLKLSLSEIQRTIVRTWQQFLPGAIAILCFLATSQVMNASGMTGVLGRSAATLGSNYALIAPWLGALGGWLTGSNAGGNAMFALLQKEISIHAHLPIYWIMAAQNGAGSIATMASPSRIILAATAASLIGQESTILRRIGLAVLMAIAAIMLLLIAIVTL